MTRAVLAVCALGLLSACGNGHREGDEYIGRWASMDTTLPAAATIDIRRDGQAFSLHQTGQGGTMPLDGVAALRNGVLQISTPSGPVPAVIVKGRLVSRGQRYRRAD
jgi:hypothetical protein